MSVSQLAYDRAHDIAGGAKSNSERSCHASSRGVGPLSKQLKRGLYLSAALCAKAPKTYALAKSFINSSMRERATPTTGSAASEAAWTVQFKSTGSSSQSHRPCRRRSDYGRGLGVRTVKSDGSMNPDLSAWANSRAMRTVASEHEGSRLAMARRTAT